MNNLRVKVDHISRTLEDLLKFGPLKPEALRGLKITENLEPDIEDKYKVPIPKMPDKIGTRYNDDPSGQRTGWILEEDVTTTILQGVLDAKKYISISRVEDKQLTTVKELLDTIEMLKAGVMIGYTGYYGLPEWEPVKFLLENKEDILQNDPNSDCFKHDLAVLWCAGKEYERGKFLCDYIGKNEKTKIVCKLTNKGSGAPVREPLIDKETHQKMLAYYFKKQEQQKKLENENDDSYLNSQWADPKNLKKHLHNGDKDIKWKFK